MAARALLAIALIVAASAATAGCAPGAPTRPPACLDLAAEAPLARRSQRRTALRAAVAKWTVANANGSVSLRASVPGYVLEDLRAAGLVGDPLYRWAPLEEVGRFNAVDGWLFRFMLCAVPRLATQCHAAQRGRGRERPTAHLSPGPAPTSNLTLTPRYSFGEREARWVAFDEWTYVAEWPAAAVPAALRDAAAVVLRLGGVDTVAKVALNGQAVGAVDNSHRCAEGAEAPAADS
jgi:hypothetical protein